LWIARKEIKDPASLLPYTIMFTFRSYKVVLTEKLYKNESEKRDPSVTFTRPLTSTEILHSCL